MVKDHIIILHEICTTHQYSNKYKKVHAFLASSVFCLFEFKEGTSLSQPASFGCRGFIYDKSLPGGPEIALQ